MALPHEARAHFAQAAFVAAVLPVDFLIFFAARELDLRCIYNNDKVPTVEERGICRLMFPLKQAGGEGRKAPERLTFGIDDVPAGLCCGLAGAGHTRRHLEFL